MCKKRGGGVFLFVLYFLASHFLLTRRKEEMKRSQQQRRRWKFKIYIFCVFLFLFYIFIYFFSVMFYYNCSDDERRGETGSLTMSISSLLPYSRVSGFLWKPCLHSLLFSVCVYTHSQELLLACLFRLDRMRGGFPVSVGIYIYIYFWLRRTCRGGWRTATDELTDRFSLAVLVCVCSVSQFYIKMWWWWWWCWPAKDTPRRIISLFIIIWHSLPG